MNSGELKRAKREVRRRILATRDAMSEPDREAESAAIVARFLQLPQARRSAVIMVFWSFGSEVSTEPLIGGLHELDAIIVLPAIVDGELEARRYVPGDTVEPTSFGAYEPSGGDVVAADRIDIVATPAVAFDRSGRRVGYGGGFYDRFFLRLRPDALRIGLAFDLQVLPSGEVLPAGHFDLRVDMVVTGSEVIGAALRGQDPGSAT